LDPGDERCGALAPAAILRSWRRNGFHVDIQATGDLAPRHPLVVPVTNGIKEGHGNHHYSTEPPAEDGSGEPFLVRKGWGRFRYRDRGRFDYRSHLPRLGQGAFPLMVMDAYGRRCAITGEKTLPALDAAHIRPFSELQSHEVQNGILMRSDIHRLFDQGYVTVTPDLRFSVSPQIRDQFHNGVIYYDLHDRPVQVPDAAEQRPDNSALEWHSSTIYRG